MYISSQSEGEFGVFEFAISCDPLPVEEPEEEPMEEPEEEPMEEPEVEPIQDIPTLSEWALICLALLMLIIGVVALRQESTALAE